MTDYEAISLVKNFVSAQAERTTRRSEIAATLASFIYDSDQWNSLELPGENDPQLTFNQTRDFINIYLPKLFPRNPFTGAIEVGVTVKNSDEKKKEQEEAKILETYEDNDMPFVLFEQGQNFFVGGAGCLYYPYDPVLQMTRILSLDPSRCHIQFSSFGTVSAFAFEDEISYEEAEQSLSKTFFQTVKSFFSPVASSRTLTRKKRITYWDKYNQIILIDGNTVLVTPNNSGIVPFAWIPNMPAPHQHEGRSDGADLYHLDREYNFRASDIGKRVKDNTRPNLAVMSSLDVDKISRGEKGILALEKDDDAKFLVVPEEKTGLAYLDRLETRMRFKMAINDAVLGQMRSNISADAMGYYFMPLLDRVALKRIFWDSAFKKLNSAILTNAFGAGTYRTAPSYHPALAVDAAFRTDIVVKQLQNHLISHTDAIDMLHGAENAPEKFSAIMEELKKYGLAESTKKEKTDPIAPEL
jgi:hypothetical protein